MTVSRGQGGGGLIRALLTLSNAAHRAPANRFGALFFFRRVVRTIGCTCPKQVAAKELWATSWCRPRF
jgi:hypothetical protein